MNKHTSGYCEYCGEKKMSGHTRFCSDDCRWSSVEDEITKGNISSPATLRRHLFQSEVHACSICGLTQWKDQPIPLIIDHIDGNPVNNKRSNLRLICPNCDALLPTYKGKNKGNGRYIRRQRYNDGKSY